VDAGDGGNALPGQATESRDEEESPGDVGREPDPRFSFANERTFLAWNRTALSLVAAGAAAAAFLRVGLGGARLLVALPLILLGSALALASYGEWKNNERALRLDQPLPYRTRLSRLLGWGVALIAAVTAVLAVVDVAVSSPSTSPPSGAASR
jgi:putative membrane protein